jgi:hypothetical protein
MSLPPTRRCVAKEWRSLGEVACLAIADGCGLDDWLEE